MKKPGINSVFRRLRYRFLLLIAVAFGVILLFLLLFVVGQQEKELSQQVNSVSHQVSAVEGQITAAVNIGKELFYDPRMGKLAGGYYQDYYGRNELVLELQSGIVQTKLVNGLIEDIVLTFPSQNLSISAEEGYVEETFSPEQFYIEPEKRAGAFCIRDGKVRLILASPMLPVSREDTMPDYQIEIVLSNEHLEDMISAFQGVEDQGAFWVFDNGHETMLLSHGEQADMMSLWLDGWRTYGPSETYQNKIPTSGGRVLFVSQTLSQGGLVLTAYQNEEQLIRSMILPLSGISCAILVIAALAVLLVNWARERIRKPTYAIMHAMERVQGGDLNVRIRHDSNDEFSYIYDAFNETIETIHNLMERTKEQAILLQKAEMLQLQSQINPHFLYNSFYNIKFMAQNEDYDQIDAMVTALAKYYRFLNKETEETVTLAAEADHMSNYIAVQQMRFGDKISVDIRQVPEAFAGLRVPKLILQPVVENAYNYGLKNVLTDGRLSVTYAEADNRLEITIEDNGCDLDERKLAAMKKQLTLRDGSAENHALNNINRRLKLFFGEDSGVVLKIGQGGGLAVTLLIQTENRS